MDPQILEVGELVTLKGRFATAAGVATDPTAVTLVVTAPNGTVTTTGPAITPYAVFGHPSAGVFTFDLTVNAAGTWTYRWSGTGAIVAGETGRLVVFAVGSAGSPRSGPCSNWISVDQLSSCEGVPETATEGQKETAIAVASDLLWRWSGYKYGGLCFDSVRPCSQNSYLEQTYPDWYGSNWGWDRRLWGTCLCQASTHDGCGCSFIPKIQLGRDPIVGIVEVRIDGAVLAATKYKIEDNFWLIRTDGNPWPCCQDLTKADAVAGGAAATLNTFAVDFVWGQNPPAAGVEAAIDLAIQTAKACVGADCAIPEEFGTIIRQGETRVNIQPTDLGRDFAGNMRQGLKSVDRFLSSQTHSRPAVVASPDIDAKVRRVAT